MGTQLDVVGFVNQQQELFLPKVIDNSVEWASESQFAIQLLQSNDFLAKTAMQNPTSAQNAILNVAAIGITLNPAQKLAYLVPRNGGVCLDISYMGLLHLAMNTGSIRWGQAVIVYSNDKFKRVGIDKAPLHEYEEFGDRGNPVGAYCTVKTSDGDYLTETMSKDEIYDIRDRSQAWKAFVARNKPCPWSTDELEMWRKTVVKRAYKYWPKVERLSNAIHYLNESGEGFEKEPVMPHHTQQQVDEAANEQDKLMKNQLAEMVNSINAATTENGLKQAFQSAYMATKGTVYQKEIVTAYNAQKGRIQ